MSRKSVFGVVCGFLVGASVALGAQTVVHEPISFARSIPHPTSTRLRGQADVVSRDGQTRDYRGNVIISLPDSHVIVTADSVKEDPATNQWTAEGHVRISLDQK